MNQRRKSEAIKLANRLSLARSRAGISQLQMAVKIGRSRSTVARWESTKNNKPPSTGDVVQISNILGVSVLWLLGLRDDPGMPDFLAPDERKIIEIYRKLRKLTSPAMMVFLTQHLAAIEEVNRIVRDAMS